MALSNGNNPLGVADRLTAQGTYVVDPCLQQAVACTTNLMASSVGANTDNYAGKADWHYMLNHTDVYFNWADDGEFYGDGKYNPAHVVTFHSTRVSTSSSYLRIAAHHTSNHA